MTMPKMSKTAQRKRLQEAMAKIRAVYLAQDGFASGVVTVTDVVAIEKILSKCMNRIK